MAVQGNVWQEHIHPFLLLFILNSILSHHTVSIIRPSLRHSFKLPVVSLASIFYAWCRTACLVHCILRFGVLYCEWAKLILLRPLHPVSSSSVNFQPPRPSAARVRKRRTMYRVAFFAICFLDVLSAAGIWVASITVSCWVCVHVSCNNPLLSLWHSILQSFCPPLYLFWADVFAVEAASCRKHVLSILYDLV